MNNVAHVEVTLSGTPEEVDALAGVLVDRLDQRGYRHDEDFELLYGAHWNVVGLRFLHLPALHAALVILDNLPAGTAR